MAKKRRKPPEAPPFEPDPLPPADLEPRVAELIPLTKTTPVLVRIAVEDHAAICDWTERQNASEAKRDAVITQGKGAGVKVPDFIRQAVREKLAHLARS